MPPHQVPAIFVATNAARADEYFQQLHARHDYTPATSIDCHGKLNTSPFSPDAAPPRDAARDAKLFPRVPPRADASADDVSLLG